jgi:Amt family ammonium transporter
MNIAGKKLAFFQSVDDTLEVFHTHFVGALVGGIGTGLFATIEGCAAFGLTNPGGAIHGNGKQVWLQIVGALFIIGWNIVWTSLIMIFIKFVCRIPLRMTDEQLIVGDYAIHGEEPYTFAHYNRNLIEPVKSSDGENGLIRIISGKNPAGDSSEKLSAQDEILPVKAKELAATRSE